MTDSFRTFSAGRVQRRPSTLDRPPASRATPTILLRTCCRRQAGRGSKDAGEKALGRKAPADPTTFDPDLDHLQQSASSASCRQTVSQLLVKSANSTRDNRVGRVGMLFTDQPQSADGKRGNAPIRRKQPRARSRAPEPSFTARQIGTASNEAFA